MQPKYGDNIYHITPENVKIVSFDASESANSYQKADSIEIIDIEGKPFIAADEIKIALHIPTNVSIHKHFKDYWSCNHFVKYENSRRNLYIQVYNEYTVKRALVSMNEDRTHVYQDIIREGARHLYKKLVEEVYPAFYADQKPVLTSFVNETIGSVRAININGESWFVAKDVCDILGLTNSRKAVASLDDDEKGKILKNAVTIDRNPELRSAMTPFVPIDSETKSINIINGDEKEKILKNAVTIGCNPKLHRTTTPISDKTDEINIINDDKKSKILENAVMTRAKKSLGRTTTPFVPIDSETKEINIINEYGLWQLIFTSNKPEAKQFKRWLAHEVIPTIRKTGSYSVFKQLKGGEL